MSILANIYLLTKNHKLKKHPAVQQKDENTHTVGVDGPYMELQKTTASPGAQDYMDLKQPQENPGTSLSGYENVKKGKEQPMTYDSPYESVEWLYTKRLPGCKPFGVWKRKKIHRATVGLWFSSGKFTVTSYRYTLNTHIINYDFMAVYS